MYPAALYRSNWKILDFFFEIHSESYNELQEWIRLIPIAFIFLLVIYENLFKFSMITKLLVKVTLFAMKDVLKFVIGKHNRRNSI